MYNYYCKKCDNIIGEWNNEFKYYNIRKYCYFLPSQNNYFIEFLNCNNCKKFVGIVCYNVCKNCFIEDIISEEENFKKFLPKYKKTLKTIPTNNYQYTFIPCQLCYNNCYKTKYWFFKYLTFYK